MPGVRVKYLGYLADYAGAREEVVEVGGEARIVDIVRIPPDVKPEDLIFLVNGRPAKPWDKIRPGDTVSVMPHVSGG